MTPGELATLKHLQQLIADGVPLTVSQQAELLRLRRELAAAPEVADDPATLFVDEARRPKTNGADFYEEQKQRSARELEAAALEGVKKYGPTLLQIAWSFLRGLFRR